MLTQFEQIKQRWSGAHNSIDNWLNERQDLLVNYCKLAGLPPYEPADDHALPTHEDIRSFCQLLMDYVSTGHFDLYGKLVNPELEQEEVDHILAELAISTDLALSFNDKYAESAQDQQLTGFDVDLSKLGQLIEDRFALEDQLIGQLVGNGN